MWGIKIPFRALTTSVLGLKKAPLELDTFNLGAQFYLELKEMFRQFESMGLNAKNSGR